MFNKFYVIIFFMEVSFVEDIIIARNAKKYDIRKVMKLMQVVYSEALDE